MSKIVAFTGHRPCKLPGRWGSNHSELCIKITKLLISEDVGRVISGGALGIDQIAIRAAMYSGAYLTLIEPFPGFWKKWPIKKIEEYMHLKYSWDEGMITFIYANENEEYASWKMQQRNEMMVDRAEEVWAYWDGSKGGTANCVAYANKKGVPVKNLIEEFKE